MIWNQKIKIAVNKNQEILFWIMRIYNPVTPDVNYGWNQKKNILSDVILTQKDRHGMYSPIGGY